MKDPIKNLQEQLNVLRDVQHDYEGHTIENIIAQIESRIKHYKE